MEARGSTLLVEHGRPEEVWARLIGRTRIKAVTAAADHEPYGRRRDTAVHRLLASHGIDFLTYKDISVFERDEVMKDDGTPYTIFTPYSRKWKALFTPDHAKPFPSERLLDRLAPMALSPGPSLGDLGFRPTGVDLSLPDLPVERLRNYERMRDLPAVEGTSRLSVHLRFGTVSIRALVRLAWAHSAAYLSELIWREFFMQVLWHFPRVEHAAFKPAYEHIRWRNDEAHFAAWCEGRTGYPLVDAGMRELNATGLMHNRVRMLTASFLTKHLLTDWRWGEAYFAKKLLDFELSSNNGNWQWVAGTGCDAAPWFRIFAPDVQLKKFDPSLRYVKCWVEEYGGTNYATPIIVHSQARNEATAAYRQGLEESRRRNEL